MSLNNKANELLQGEIPVSRSDLGKALGITNAKVLSAEIGKLLEDRKIKPVKMNGETFFTAPVPKVGKE